MKNKRVNIEAVQASKSNSKVYFWILLFIMMLPMIHSKTAIYGTVVHRVLFFWLLVDFAAIYALIQQKNSVLKLNLLATMLLLYTVVLLAANLVGVSPFNSLFSNFERMNGFVTWLHFVLFFFVFNDKKFTTKEWVLIATVGMLVAAYIAIFGLMERNYKTDGRLQSVLSNPMHLAGYLLMVFFFGLLIFPYLWQQRTLLSAKFALIALVFLLFLFAFTLFLTKTRSGVLGLLVGIIVFLLAISLQKRSAIKWTFGGIFSIVLMVVYVYSNRESNWVFQNPILNKMTDLNFNSTTISSRLKVWQMTISGLFEHPFLGWGQGNFTHFFVKNFQPSMYDVGFWYDSSHNFILDKIIETGFVGLLMYVVFICVIFYFIWNKKSLLSGWEKGTLTGALVAYFVFLLFGFESFVSSFAFFLILVFVAQNNSETSLFKGIHLSEKTHKIVLFVGVITVTLSFWQFVYRSWKTNEAITSAYNANEFDGMVKLHETSYKESLIGNYDIVLQYLTKNEQVTTSNLTKEMLTIYSASAEKMVNDAFVSFPKHPILLSQLGFVYATTGNRPKAIETYKKLATIAPNRQVNLIDLGVFYLENNEAAKAFEVFEKMDRADTTFQIPRLYMGLALAKMGLPAIAHRYISSVEKKEAIGYKNVVYAAYAQMNELKKYPYFFVAIKKDNFKQTDYLEWVEVAYALNDTSQIEYAFVSYDRHFPPIANEKKELFALMKKVKNREEQPIAMSHFFSRFPNR